MKRKKKILLTISIIIIFIGILLTSSSSICTIKEEESVTENSITYSISGSQDIKNGSKITRYFKTGEKMTIRFTHALKPPYFDFYLINFTIISPNGNPTVFWFELEPYFNPYSGQTQLVITNLTIGKTFIDLDTSLTTQSKFIGRACTEGNYTLIFTSQYPFPVLSYMALVKIVTIKEYPYADALPLGIALLCTGTILAFCTIKMQNGRQKPKK